MHADQLGNRADGTDFCICLSSGNKYEPLHLDEKLLWAGETILAGYLLHGGHDGVLELGAGRQLPRGGRAAVDGANRRPSQFGAARDYAQLPRVNIWHRVRLQHGAHMTQSAAARMASHRFMACNFDSEHWVTARSPSLLLQVQGCALSLEHKKASLGFDVGTDRPTHRRVPLLVGHPSSKATNTGKVIHRLRGRCHRGG